MNNSTPQLIKVSAWLADLDGHTIYDDTSIRADFKKRTGFEAPWIAHTHTDTVKRMNDRGLGGNVENEPLKMLCYGHEMAVTCARYFVGFRSIKIGRGSAFRECIEMLDKAGQ